MSALGTKSDYYTSKTSRIERDLFSLKGALREYKYNAAQRHLEKIKEEVNRIEEKLKKEEKEKLQVSV